jgi:hypothetical protein
VCLLGDVPKFPLSIILAGKFIVLIPSWMKRTVAVSPVDQWTVGRSFIWPHTCSTMYDYPLLTHTPFCFMNSLFLQNICIKGLAYCATTALNSTWPRVTKLIIRCCVGTCKFTIYAILTRPNRPKNKCDSVGAWFQSQWSHTLVSTFLRQMTTGEEVRHSASSTLFKFTFTFKLFTTVR